MGDINTLKDTNAVTTIQSLDDRPVLATTNALKAKFDEYPDDLRERVNNLIDYLLKNNNTDDGASNIGINSPYATTVKGLFDYILGLGTGTLPPDGSITNDKLATTNKTGLLADLTTTAKTTLVAAINEILSTLTSTCGLLVNLTTSAKTNLVAAINELVSINSYNVGEVKYFAMSIAPTGYLKANGAAVSRSAYASLFTAIGTTFGVGDGSTTFNLPDLRGVFPRGWDDGRGYDTGRVFGSYQADDIKAHGHTFTTSSNGDHNHTYSQYNTSVYGSGNGNNQPVNTTSSTTTGNAGTHTHTGTTDNNGSATETKVKNVALLACIKY
jgi:microcystin-dependent protein